MIKKDPTVHYLKETSPTSQYTYKLKVKEWKMMFQAKGAWKLAGIATLIHNKADFRPKLIRVHKENILLVNIYVPNIDSPNFIYKHFSK